MANFLIKDLEENYLSVELINALESKHVNHKIRNVQNQNPEWYKILYDRCIPKFPQKRKGSGRKSKYIRSALRRITKGVFNNLHHAHGRNYTLILLDLIKDMLLNGYTYMDQEIPFDKEIKEYFNEIEKNS